MSRDGAVAIGPAQFLLLLHSVPHIGEKALARLLRLTSQGRLVPEECLRLSASEWKERYELHPQAAAYLEQNREALIAQSAEMARTVRAHSLQILTQQSATYPARLERFDDAPPPLLYALGNPALLGGSENSPFTFTIAVSNGADPSWKPRLEEIGAELVRAGGVPVTGHDRPPYKQMALTAQRQNRPILYVLDRGLREALGPEFDRPPFAAARIRDAVFDTDRDLALSPFRMDDHSIGANNRRRDRLIFALSDVIIALETRAGGGMAGECLRALEQRKGVYVAEGGSDGNAFLREQGCPPLPKETGWAEQIAARLTNSFG